MCPPEEGWSWLVAVFPKDPVSLRRAVTQARECVEFEGRKYFLASSGKGCTSRGAVACLASPPGGPGSIKSSCLRYRCWHVLMSQNDWAKQTPCRRPHPDSMPGPPSSRFCDCVVARSSALEIAAGLQGLKILGTIGVDPYRFAMVFPALLSCASRT